MSYELAEGVEISAVDTLGNGGMAMPEEEVSRSLWQNGLYFFSMVGILVFANWGMPQSAEGAWALIYNTKWLITSGFSFLFGVILVRWFGLAIWKAPGGYAHTREQMRTPKAFFQVYG